MDPNKLFDEPVSKDKLIDVYCKIRCFCRKDWHFYEEAMKYAKDMARLYLCNIICLYARRPDFRSSSLEELELKLAIRGY